jgi:hypothetical protein
MKSECLFAYTEWILLANAINGYSYEQNFFCIYLLAYRLSKGMHWLLSDDLMQPRVTKDLVLIHARAKRF